MDIISRWANDFEYRVSIIDYVVYCVFLGKFFLANIVVDIYIMEAD